MTYTRDELWKAFMALGQKGLAYTHYDLAAKTSIQDHLAWKNFLMDPQVAEYVRSEMEIIRSATINEMIQNSATSRSVGQSQLLNSLLKYEDANSQKSGPAFIFMHVPLSPVQKDAPNVRLCDEKGVELTDDGTYIIDES